MVKIAPVMISDPIKEELKTLSRKFNYGTSLDVSELVKLYEQKAGLRRFCLRTAHAT